MLSRITSQKVVESIRHQGGGIAWAFTLLLLVGQAFGTAHFIQSHTDAHGSSVASYAESGAEIAHIEVSGSHPSNSEHLVDCDLCGHSIGLAAAVQVAPWYLSFVELPLYTHYSFERSRAPTPYVFASPRAPPIA